jgi:hypothetical protein
MILTGGVAVNERAGCGVAACLAISFRFLVRSLTNR